MSHPTTLIKGTSYKTEFRVYDPSNPGQAKAPDSLPTATVYKNLVANGDSVTITLISTGLYKLTYTPSGEVEGDFFAIDINVVISSTNYPEVINFVVRTAEPTVGAIADAVWDEPQADHEAGGSFGAYLVAMTSTIVSISNRLGLITGSGVNTVLGFFKAIMRADASLPSDIGGTVSPVTDSLEALGTAVDGLSSNLGSGADSCTLRIRETDLTPVADADVWITTDSAGTNVIAGTRQTNASGQVTFLLDAGVTYYLWAQKDGWEGIQGTSFVAVAD